MVTRAQRNAGYTAMLSDPGHRVGNMPSLPGPIGLQPNFNRRLAGPNKELDRAVRTIHTAADFANLARSGYHAYKAVKGVHEAHARAKAANDANMKTNAAYQSYADAWAMAGPDQYGNAYQGGIDDANKAAQMAQARQRLKETTLSGRRKMQAEARSKGLPIPPTNPPSSYTPPTAPNVQDWAADQGVIRRGPTPPPVQTTSTPTKSSGKSRSIPPKPEPAPPAVTTPFRVNPGTSGESSPIQPDAGNPFNDLVTQAGASRQAPPPVQTTSTPTQSSGTSRSIPPKPAPAPTPTPFKVNRGSAGSSPTPAPSSPSTNPLHEWASQAGAERAASAPPAPKTTSAPTPSSGKSRSMPPRPATSQPVPPQATPTGRPVAGPPSGVPNNFAGIRNGTNVSPPARVPLVTERPPRVERPSGVAGTLRWSMNRAESINNPYITPPRP